MPGELASVENLSALRKQLECSELEAPEGICTGDKYLQLLAIYIYCGELCSAKFLWKRIPQPMKESQPALGLLWAVGQSMWKRDSSSISLTLEQQWPDEIKHIMNALVENTREKTLRLIAKVYTSITVAEVSNMLSTPANDVITLVTSLGWTLSTDHQMVYPVHIRGAETSSDVLLKQNVNLASLTQLVSHLEN